VDGGDRFSDVDLTFAVADQVPVAEVLVVGQPGSLMNWPRSGSPILSAARRSTASSCCRTRLNSTFR
jgi:hypothetical protein